MPSGDGNEASGDLFNTKTYCSELNKDENK